MTVTKEKPNPFIELHFEHQLWMNEIGFYKDELLVFNKRMDEVSSKYSNKMVLASLGHFQKEFILQSELSEELLHDLYLHELYLFQTAKELPTSINRKAFADHPRMRNRINSFLKIYREVRHDYMKFISKVN